MNNETQKIMMDMVDYIIRNVGAANINESNVAEVILALIPKYIRTQERMATIAITHPEQFAEQLLQFIIADRAA